MLVRPYEEVEVLLRSYEEVKVGNMKGPLIRSYNFVEGYSVVDGNVVNLWGIIADIVGNKVGDYVVVGNVANSRGIGEGLNYFQVHFMTRPRKVGASRIVCHSGPFQGSHTL